MNIYYVYQYLREDQTPYYIGKGKDNRILEKHNVGIPPTNRIVKIAENLCEKEAFDLEIELIAKYGRKDLGTGILRNMTNGGEGPSGAIHSPETKAKRSKSLTGLKRPPRTEEHKQKLSKSNKGVPKPRTKEHQDAWTEASIAKWFNNTERKKQVSAMGKANIGRKHTTEALEKKRIAMQAYWAKKKGLPS
jgi:hypothetical protein